MNESEVDHPKHYNQNASGVECIAVVEHMNFNRGNAIKYIWRAGDKGDAVTDLRKAAWYLNREIERVKREQLTAFGVQEPIPQPMTRADAHALLYDGHDIDSGGNCRKTGCNWDSDTNRHHNEPEPRTFNDPTTEPPTHLTLTSADGMVLKWGTYGLRESPDNDMHVTWWWINQAQPQHAPWSHWCNAHGPWTEVTDG